MTDEEISTYLRVSFYQDETPLPALLCRDVYADQIAANSNRGYFNSIFPSDEYWICPQVAQIEVLNDSKFFKAMVQQCGSVQSTDDEFGLESYADVNGRQTCKDSTAIDDIVSNFEVKSQQINQFFNVLEFKQNRSLGYITQNFQIESLWSSLWIQRSYTVQKRINTVYDSFFYASKETANLVSYDNQVGQFRQILRSDSEQYYELMLHQGTEKSTINWTQVYLSGFLSTLGGLFTSLLGFVTFFISGYQNFVSDKSMIKKLYGEIEATAETDDAMEAPLNEENSPKALLRAKLKQRQEFKSGYCMSLLVFWLKICCCCCKGSFKRQVDQQRKFTIAQQRLMREQDIQHLIEMNRLTRLMHKGRFLSRQKQIVDYSHRYVLTQEDIDKPEKKDSELFIETVHIQDDLLNYLVAEFDPENDQMDRRLLYEVTGVQLEPGEFDGECSSDSDRGGGLQYTTEQGLSVNIN